VAVTLLDNYGSLSAIFVPTTVQATIMSIVSVLGSRSTKFAACAILAAISVHAAVAANTNAELLSAGDTWDAQSYCRQRGTS
jgi:hypothetical protein